MKSHLYRLLVVLCLILPGTAAQGKDTSTLLNDLHCRLNPTRVQEVLYPEDTDDVINIVLRANRENTAISISGGMHALWSICVSTTVMPGCGKRATNSGA